MTLRPSSRIKPQDGVGGRVPKPRKLNAASAMTAQAKATVVCTMRAGKQLGNTCLRRIRLSEAPMLFDCQCGDWQELEAHARRELISIGPEDAQGIMTPHPLLLRVAEMSKPDTSHFEFLIVDRATAGKNDAFFSYFCHHLL